MNISIDHIGVATVLFSIDGTTFINDPCFNEGGGWYHHGWGAFSKKTADPRLTPDELPREPDVGLVTHGHHEDNLDDAGRTFLNRVPTVVSTDYSAPSLEGAIGLKPGQSHSLDTETTSVTIHAVPARHGVYPLSILSGPVNGYIVEIGEEPLRIYVSGDTIFTRSIVSDVSQFGSIDLFFPHLGNACFPYLSGPFRYTMNADDLRSFVDVLEPDYTYPIHNAGWSHFRPVELSCVNGLESGTNLLTAPECTVSIDR